jgi:ABC-type sugar transport system permease subunit
VKSKKILSYEKKRQKYGWLFISPWLIGLLIFFCRPIISSLKYSFSEISLEGGLNTTFIGISQYNELLFKDTEYLPALLEAFKNLIQTVPLVLAFSLFVAIILNQDFIGRTFSRALFFLPVIVASGVVLQMLNEDAVNSSMMYENMNTTLFGATGLKVLLTQMNLPTDIVSSLVGVVNGVFEMVWKSGIQILLFLSGLQSIPGSYYETANIEGANVWMAFWKITFPMLLPTLLVAVVYSIVDSFTYYSNPVMELIDITYLEKLRFGYASAMSWLYFVLIMVILAFVFFVLGKFIKRNTA